MSDIGYNLSRPVSKYIHGEIDKEAFKQKIRHVEETVEGANWWTISTALSSEVGGVLNSQEDRICVLAVLLELYSSKDLERVFAEKDLRKAESMIDN